MILGVVLTVLVIFLFSVLRLFLTRITDRTFDNAVPYLRPDGEEILQELMDAARERALARSLSHRQFREQQLNRIRLADEYIRHRSHNATVLQGWGDTELRAARESGHEEMTQAADALVIACTDFRIGASSIRLQLHIWQFKLILLPFARLPRISSVRKVDDFDLFASYESIAEAALRLAQACGGDYYDRLLEAL